MKGKKRHDFDISFRRSLKALYKSDESMDYKKAEIDRMLEGYVAATGEYPSGTFLEMMADVLLSDELRSTDMDKVTNTEYPILSENQLKRRTSGTLAISETPLIPAEVDYHLNSLTSEHLVYKPPLQTFNESIKEPNQTICEKEPIHYAATKRNGNGTRSEDDAKWSKTIKERDGYRCQNPRCNSRVGIMHAHHIESYIDNPDKRTQLSNGITLCTDCHTGFHSVYGKGGNNHQQLDEFFADSLAI